MSRVVGQAQLAAQAAGQRAAAAADRKDVARARARELAERKSHPIEDRPEEAATRLVAAREAAESAHRAAIEGCERAAMAHEYAAGAHERAAEIATGRGDPTRAAQQQELATEARAAASAARVMAMPPGNQNADTAQDRPASAVSRS